MSEINVTPFVDVMLVLLIIFMVTAPLLTVGVQVDLPESAADSLPDDQEPLTVSINSKGEIFIQENKVSAETIIPKLLAIAKNRTDTRIYVRGDKNINYGRVLEIMGTNVSTTYITAPAKKKMTLGIKLQFLVMIIKNV